jgi:transcriptional regulator GlxA family with amidase domain
MRIAILLYDGFDELDAIGPYEVLRGAQRAGAEAEVLLVTLEPSPRIVGSHGLAVEPQGTLEEGSADLVIVPGGGWNDRARAGAYAEAQRGELPAALTRLHDQGAVVASVCTGGMLVSAAGLLRGRPATTHHGALAELSAQGARLIDARVVDDSDVLSCGGVTSGIDLALWIVEREWGAPMADLIAQEIEHDRRGPVWTGDRAAS